MRMHFVGLRVFGLAIGILVLASGSGCDRNLEPFDASEEVRSPDLARIFPDEARSGPGLRAGVVPPDDTPSAPAREGLRASASGAAPIRGRIDVAPDLGAKLPPGAILFIIARRGAGGGPPLAVRRIPAPQFPLEFSVGPEDVMIPSMKFEGDIQITARLDGDGNAMTRNPGDLQGAAPEMVRPGGQVSLVLDQQL